MFWKNAKPISLVAKLTILYCFSLLIIISIITGYIYYPLNEILHYSKHIPTNFPTTLVFTCIRKLFIVVGFAAALSTLLSYLITKKSLKHLYRFSSSLSKIKSHSLDTRLDSRQFPKELDKLSHTCNEMLENIQKDFCELKRFSANIAHELRNPIHYLQNTAEVTLSKPQTEVAYREMLENHFEEHQNLSVLIDNLLLLARSEYQLNAPDKAMIDMNRMVSDLIEYYSYLAEEKSIRFNVQVQNSVVADQALLKRAIANIIDNAVKFSPADSEITIQGKHYHSNYQLTVIDKGIGISNEALQSIFSPFHKQIKDNANGLGLGLAIAKAIIYQHGGEIDIQSNLGSGTAIIIKLPLT
jgi:two-component system heavy metal sensor histidine kinase CusS